MDGSRRGSPPGGLLALTATHPPTCHATAQLSMWSCAPFVPPENHDHDENAHDAPKATPNARSPRPGATFATRRSGVRVPLAPRWRGVVKRRVRRFELASVSSSLVRTAPRDQRVGDGVVVAQDGRLVVAMGSPAHVGGVWLSRSVWTRGIGPCVTSGSRRPRVILVVVCDDAEAVAVPRYYNQLCR
jgi:hypothetical protein